MGLGTGRTHRSQEVPETSKSPIFKAVSDA